MAEYAALFISAVVINNFVLTKFLGLCIFFGISKNLSASAGMGVAVTAVVKPELWGRVRDFVTEEE